MKQYFQESKRIKLKWTMRWFLKHKMVEHHNHNILLSKHDVLCKIREKKLKPEAMMKNGMEGGKKIHNKIPTMA
jgi:hypothetical protein